MTFTVLVFFALVRSMLSRSERNVKYGEKRSAVLSVSADQRSSSAFDGFPTVKNPPHPKHPSVEASVRRPLRGIELGCGTGVAGELAKFQLRK